MTDDDLRDLIATDLTRTHDNALFIAQVRAGLQDDGPYMRAAFVVRDHYVAMLAPAPEEIDA